VPELATSLLFIDGTNFFLRHRQLYPGKIVDYRKFIPRLIETCGYRTQLKAAFFFTAPFTHNTNSQIYSEHVSLMNHIQDAVRQYLPIELINGRHQKKEVYCPLCNATFQTQREKRTDVAMATRMIQAAFRKEADTFLLVTEDSDFIPAIVASKELGIDVILFSLAHDTIDQLRSCVNAVVILDRDILYNSWRPPNNRRMSET